MNRAQFRRCCFTLNNYTDDEIGDIVTMVTEKQMKGCIGREIAPTTGTPHLQGVLGGCGKAFRTGEWCKMLGGRASVQPCKNWIQSISYCRKENNMLWDSGESAPDWRGASSPKTLEYALQQQIAKLKIPKIPKAKFYMDKDKKKMYWHDWNYCLWRHGYKIRGEWFTLIWPSEKGYKWKRFDNVHSLIQEGRAHYQALTKEVEKRENGSSRTEDSSRVVLARCAFTSKAATSSRE